MLMCIETLRGNSVCSMTKKKFIFMSHIYKISPVEYFGGKVGVSNSNVDDLKKSVCLHSM